MTVSADVDDVITPRSFRIAAEDIGGSGLLDFGFEAREDAGDFEGEPAIAAKAVTVVSGGGGG